MLLNCIILLRMWENGPFNVFPIWNYEMGIQIAPYEMNSKFAFTY